MFSGQGYATKGFNGEIPDKVKTVLFGLIGEVARRSREEEVDQTQIFDLNSIEGGILVRHYQEKPLKEGLIILTGFVGVQISKKVYAIDGGDRYTLMLENEM